MSKLHKFGCTDRYTLILTDINMPEMDGVMMTKRIREIYKDWNEISQDLSRFTFGGGKCIIWAITAMNEDELEGM
jgi:CheY-like chemotaxis protein